MWFDTSDYHRIGRGNNDIVMRYQCRHCEKAQKIFALWVYKGDGDCFVTKYGEVPPFGPPLPERLLSIAGADREYLLKGRRAENQGLGVAAFAYYRRVVENRKGELFDQIIRVGKQVGASSDVIAELLRARDETQFDKAINEIKPGVPQSLLIDGQNPLRLLHSALSAGIHEGHD